VSDATGEAAYFVRRLCRRVERAARSRSLRSDAERLRDAAGALVLEMIRRYERTRSFV
jgi:hypothetical protein